MAENVVLIAPIAHDFARNQFGSVVLGPGTIRSIQHAISVAYDTYKARLFFSVPRAGKKWDYVGMGCMMETFVNTRAPALYTVFYQAPYFSTLGEVMAIANYIQSCQDLDGSEAVAKVVITVKSWHAERVRQLVNLVFDWKQILVPVEVKMHFARGTRLDMWLEPYKLWRNKRQIAALKRLGF